jgi:NAD(P)H-hydrate epimerase
VDVPSGLGEALSAESFILPATWTLSLEPRKAALYAPALRPRAGRILPVEGVFPLDAPKELLGRLLEEADLASLLPPEDPDAFKGKRGRLGVLAGSPSYAGAAALALRGALSAGAGYISYFAGPSLYAQLSSQGGAAIGASAGTVIKRESELEASLASLDALLVGPGWLPGEEGRALLGRLLDRGMPALLDAGAIRLLPGLLDRGFKASAPLILTPHPGEFAPLSGLGAESFLAEPAGPLRDCARRSGAMLVVKASVSWMAHPEGEIAVFEGREASLGIAGSGDVLAGLGAGLLAREAGAAGAWKALRATVLAHGIAGRRLRRRLGWYEAEALAREAAALLGGIDHGPAA